MYNIYFDEYNEEKLDYLRRNTKLNPKEYLKVLKERLEAIKYQKIYQKYHPHNHIEADYRNANLTEYMFRIKAWENKYSDTWKKYGYGMSIEEYAIMALNKLIREEKIIRRKS